MKRASAAAPKAALSLKARALTWLAQREQSRVELRRKLLPLARAEAAAAQAAAAAAPGAAEAGEAGRKTEPDTGHGTGHGTGHQTGHESRLSPEQQVEALLDWLQAHQHLSAERFVESRLHSRAARFGNRRIGHELAQHGLVLNEEQRQALQGSELQRAQALVERRWGGAPARIEAAEAARRMRFLAARGFSAEVIRQALKAHADTLSACDFPDESG